MSDAQAPTPPPGLIIREARPDDNEALIALELETPLALEDADEFFDRSPDYFAAERLHDATRVVVADVDGRIVGVTAGLMTEPVVQGARRNLVYIHRSRVRPEFHGKGIGFLLSDALFKWSGGLGAEGPYYVIAPANARSIAFGGRAGRRWPVDVRLASFDTAKAEALPLEPLGRERLAEAASLINASHEGDDFFAPLTAAAFETRLTRDAAYSLDHVFGVSDGGRLVAVAGFYDRGAFTERLHVDRRTGDLRRTRDAAVVDWGFARGHEASFAALLRSLAARARTLGRTALTICEPRAGALPDVELPATASALALFTPTIDPPPVDKVGGLYHDLLFG